MNVISYFENEEAQRRALGACSGFLDGKGWAVSDRLVFYGLSREAFRSNGDAAGFRRIYEELVRPARADGWGIARNSAGPLWTAEKTFQVLRDEFSRFEWGGATTLLNFGTGGAGLTLEPLLEGMRGFKPLRSASNWPVMAVSKVLHFFNAELFPVYDNEVIWNLVMTHFLNEFREFCRSFRPRYDTGYTTTFYMNYMSWGSALLRSAHPRFMQNFAGWLSEFTAADLPRGSFDLSTLYATAFEFTIIGAYADSVGRQEVAASKVAHCKAS